jgi:hypothetical protein
LIEGNFVENLKYMTMQRVNISHVSNEHSRWLRSLNFYKTEISILRGILTQVAGKNTSDEVMKEVEHFENQFTIQTDNIDRLSHDIHKNLSEIASQVQKSSAGYVDGELLTEHTILGSKFESEERIIAELTQMFRKFAEKWM